jgi:hypothetical protein
MSRTLFQRTRGCCPSSSPPAQRAGRNAPAGEGGSDVRRTLQKSGEFIHRTAENVEGDLSDEDSDRTTSTMGISTSWMIRMGAIWW